MIPLSVLPAVHATLNGVSAAFLLTGYSLIRRKKITGHKVVMVSAFVVSSLFLASYLYYDYHHGSTPFPGQGWIRSVYFTILISHLVLAAAIVPLALTTLYRAWKEKFPRHVRLARWTLPLWLYVSVTGVVIFWMFYLSPWATPPAAGIPWEPNWFAAWYPAFCGRCNWKAATE